MCFVVDRLASVGAMVWIGLNHLKDGWGWQWSDRAPLSLVNFTTGKNKSAPDCFFPHIHLSHEYILGVKCSFSTVLQTHVCNESGSQHVFVYL